MAAEGDLQEFRVMILRSSSQIQRQRCGSSYDGLPAIDGVARMDDRLLAAG